MVKGLLERLNAGDPVLVAEGYLFEFERLGYLQAGGFVPEVVLEHPDRVRLLHEDFVHAGSDVVQAFTFYTNPAKMAVQGRKPHEYEEINRKALRIAKEVAVKTGTLMCGDLSATNQYSPAAEDIAVVRQVFKEQVQWAVEEGADFIVGETFWSYGEAELCLEAIQKYGNGKRAFFDDLDCWLSAQSEVNTFAEEMKALNVNYVGLCCGNNPRLTRRLAECYGRHPPASRYTSDMSKHIFLGNDKSVKENAFVRKTLREAMDVATDDIKNLNEHKSTVQ